MLKAEHPVELEELMAYLDGELDGERAGVAAEHLERCAECKEAAENFRGVSRALMAWKVEEGAVEMPGGKVRRPWGWGWGWKVAAAGVAAVGLMAVVVSFRALRPLPVGSKAAPARVAGLAASEYIDQRAEMAGQPRQIARTATLELVVQDFSRARERMEDLVSRHHGYFGEMSAHSDIGMPAWLSAQLQIPSTEFTGALAELRQLGRIAVETQTAQDVTKQSMDLDARLANFRISEQRLKELLQQRTGRLSEVLEVEQQITRVRGEIEQMESQRRSLSHRVDYVGISVRVSEPAAGPASSGTLGDAARSGWKNFVGGLTGLAEFVLTIGPSAVLWGGLLFFPVRFAWRRWARRAN